MATKKPQPSNWKCDLLWPGITLRNSGTSVLPVELDAPHFRDVWQFLSEASSLSWLILQQTLIWGGGGDIFCASFLPPQTDIFKVPAKIVGSRKLEKNMLFWILKYFSQPVYEELWYLPAAEQGSEFQEGGVFCAYPAFLYFFSFLISQWKFPWLFLIYRH